MGRAISRWPLLPRSLASPAPGQVPTQSQCGFRLPPTARSSFSLRSGSAADTWYPAPALCARPRRPKRNPFASNGSPPIEHHRSGEKQNRKSNAPAGCDDEHLGCLFQPWQVACRISRCILPGGNLVVYVIVLRRGRRAPMNETIWVAIYRRPVTGLVACLSVAMTLGGGRATIFPGLCKSQALSKRNRGICGRRPCCTRTSSTLSSTSTGFRF